ncbi:DUF340 domain-containing protein [Clostridium sp. OF09-10]|jgi:hypothetical protein|nr:DUF340 domain-containing protein [Clostridium sp. OF09-10]RHW01244.1 DUF340 domain-containing protein [Clostridium sp. OF09-10]
MDAAVWFKRIKCLVLVCIFASIGNFISTSKAGNPVTPIEAIPGLVLLLACTLIGCLIYELVGKVSSKNLPAIAYISFIAIFMTIPGISPIAEYAIEQVGKIGLLPLCTPILAYAGISIGKDMDTFKEQGLAIVIVAIFTFAGTFLGSTIIAQIILKMTGVI